MEDQNKNLILASVLSFIVIMVWVVLFPPPTPVEDPNATATTTQGGATAPVAASTAPAAAATQSVATAAADTPRISIETPRILGSISLLGGRIDQISLKDYRQTTDPDSPIVDVMRPVGAQDAYYALYGWSPANGLSLDSVPGPDTVWTAPAGAALSPESPVTLTWDNGSGLTFTRQISVDQDYMFAITQSVQNASGSTIALAPYGTLTRHGTPSDLKKFFILHEGTVAMTDGTLDEQTYKKIAKFDFNAAQGSKAVVTTAETSGWIGFTDHYWLSALIPADGQPVRQINKYIENRDIYQTATLMPTQTVADGANINITTRLFVGAKEWETLKHYQNEEGVAGFVDSIDWGWFFFLTKPIFALLHKLNAMIGNMGWAIIALTFILKGIVFPLAYKSYASMAKMKELQPKMEKLKEEAGGDRQKMQQAMMELYKKEKVNPASGCLPILIQIPIFFSLYKVIFVTLELRHAPWLGWINDLSAPDPSSILNLFGLLPFAAPDPSSILAFVSLGILPILLGISMWLQQKLNPAPTDQTQAMIFAWMPWVFMFMLGGFASGLVIYWITNNTITFIQQYSIMRLHGYKPDVFGNIRKSFAKKTKGDAK